MTSIAYRRAALDDPPAHSSYVVAGAANGNADERLSQARRLADVYCYCTSGTANVMGVAVPPALMVRAKNVIE